MKPPWMFEIIKRCWVVSQPSKNSGAFITRQERICSPDKDGCRNTGNMESELFASGHIGVLCGELFTAGSY